MDIVPGCPKVTRKFYLLIINVMKKLSLGKLRLSGDEVLERSQLASIFGGSGSCGYATRSGPGGAWYGCCTVSGSQAAEFMTQGYSSSDAYWCCNSCSTTFYCGNGSGSGSSGG